MFHRMHFNMVIIFQVIVTNITLILILLRSRFSKITTAHHLKNAHITFVLLRHMFLCVTAQFTLLLRFIHADVAVVPQFRLLLVTRHVSHEFVQVFRLVIAGGTLETVRCGVFVFRDDVFFKVTSTIAYEITQATRKCSFGQFGVSFIRVRLVDRCFWHFLCVQFEFVWIFSMSSETVFSVTFPWVLWRIITQIIFSIRGGFWWKFPIF